MILIRLFCIGLGAYNSFIVIESLPTLAKDFNRIVVFTIHQPQSNIVSLFDQLVVLAQGKLVYSGEMARYQRYSEGIGNPVRLGLILLIFLSELFFTSLLIDCDGC